MIGRAKTNWLNSVTVFVSILVLSPQPSCRPQPASETGSQTAFSQEQIVAKVRKIVAKKLAVDPNAIDVDIPLSKQKQSADELDAVEIILDVEAAFQTEIKEEEVGGTSPGLADRLSVRRLSEIVQQRKAEK
jgi:acyl carrier protein